MNTLYDLCVKHGTDKTYYAKFYDLLLCHRRKRIMRILEFGIGSVTAMAHVPGYQPGASLRVWRDYFPYSVVFGVDRDREVLFQDERIHTRYCDEESDSDLEAIAAWVGHVDLIVDDGSHVSADQVRAFKHLFPVVSPGGLYIIEDIYNFDEVSPNLGHDHADVYFHTSLTGRCIVIEKEP